MNKFIFFIAVLLLINFAFTQQSVVEELKNAKDTIDLMKLNGLTTNRVEDLYFIANDTYLTQLDNNSSDFGLVFSKLSELNIIANQAFNVIDEFKLFDKELSDANSEIDLKEILPIYEIAKKELKDERYSNALDELTNARDKIAELKSFGSKTRLLSEQFGKGILVFLNAIKYWAIGLFILLILVCVLFRKQIDRVGLKRSYRKYERQKFVLLNLIKKLQTEYFVENKISETSYRIKLKKYEDLVNEVSKEMAILKEELSK